jgi:hypothetical protein
LIQKETLDSVEFESIFADAKRAPVPALAPA